jgi:hypothetical protein
MSQEEKLLREVVSELKALREEMVLLRESQAPGTFPRQVLWKLWIENRRLGPQKAAEEAAKKQSVGRLAIAHGGNNVPAKIIPEDPNANIDRQAPAFLETVS